MTTSNEELIATYRRVGSIWKTGKELGIAGQSVHARLQALGVAMEGVGRPWTEEETSELIRMRENGVPLFEVSDRLGRSYASVACKANEVRSAYKRVPTARAPKGYSKAKIAKAIKEIDGSGTTLRKYAAANSMTTETLAKTIEQEHPEWWESYKRSHTDVFEAVCEYCGSKFYSISKRQKSCTRRCGATRRADESYFGGNRRSTIGLDDQVCQICLQHIKKGLSSHHVLGKENDPDNDYLVALCRGCHKIVTMLGSRKFISNPAAWERVIQYSYLRAHGERMASGPWSVYTEVILEEWDESEED